MQVEASVPTLPATSTMQGKGMNVRSRLQRFETGSREQRGLASILSR